MGHIALVTVPVGNGAQHPDRRHNMTSRTSICGAKMPDGSRCMAAPVEGKTRCHRHGGAIHGGKDARGPQAAV